MPTECYPISVLPHASRLFLDYVERHEALSPFYSISPHSTAWMQSEPVLEPQQRAAIADLLDEQSRGFGAGETAHANIQKLRDGAAAVVTGQQVALFGGPLFTLLKAVSAIRLAADATTAGRPTVPVFWLASEDHDYAEIDHVVLPDRHALHTLRLTAKHRAQSPVGELQLGPEIAAVLEQAEQLLGPGAVTDLLRDCYGPGNTLAKAFGRLLAGIFAPWGLIVMDASARRCHALGEPVFREAIEKADDLHQALLERDRELQARGYHAQVLVGEGSSLLFLLDKDSGSRLALKKMEGGKWRAGGREYQQDELLAILKEEPERLSPNALLRPVFQDAILPTAAYIGGPAEIAYFAQSEVLYRALLGRVTPVLPRLSATLVEPAIATAMQRHELSLTDTYTQVEALAHKLGARAMPMEGKRKLSAAGEALHRELEEVTAWMAALDEGLGRAAQTSASKMRYQMNRLRRLAANHQLRVEDSLRRHAEAVGQSLYPEGHPQERVIGGVYFLARYGEGLIPALLEAAGPQCQGHRVLYL